MGFIYKIISPTNKIYVGKTYDINKRISDYKCFRQRSKKSLIIDSIKKYGWNSHILQIIEEVEDEKMNEREIFWIAELKTYAYENGDGMNLTKGGDGQRHSWKHEKERVAKAKLRCGVNSPTFGRSPSKEERERIAIGVSNYNIMNGKKPSLKCHEASSNKLSKPVLCYNINGEFLHEYKSIKEAAKILGIDRKTANDALNGKQHHGGGYIFKRPTKNYPLKIEVDKSKILIRRRPILCFFDGDIIAEFTTLKEVSKNLNIKIGTVEDAFYGNRITRNGFYFIYKDLYEEVCKIAS